MRTGNLTLLAILLFFGILLLVPAIAAQDTRVDFNQYYTFPFSLGVEYQTLSPFGEYGAEYNIFELSVHARKPIPSYPVWQPGLQVGFINFDNQNLENPLTWDHQHYYIQLAAHYTHRFDRNFEIGAELSAGITQTVFQNLLPQQGPVGTQNLLFGSGATISLDPSYHTAISIHPNLKYLYSLGNLDDFNGFIFGIGFSIEYRFGDDPDAASSIIRSLRFSRPEVSALFAAMQSYYVSNPIGTVTVTNTDSRVVQDLEFTFFQAGFMDSPTPSASVPELGPGESIIVPFHASYNQKVFTLEGTTPLTGEIQVRYSTRGRPAEQRVSVSYDLYDKKSMVWDDDRKVAAFITPADSALRNYASFIRQSCRAETISAFSEPLQYAMQLYHALGEIGCLYQVDPTLPFTKVQESSMVVDSISLPRETLRNISGDCDDLTVLFCSMLETVGIQSAFITVPGHIYAAFNTKVPSRDFASIHPERRMTIPIEGELWVPVEITLIGEAGFQEAWRKGIDQWAALEEQSGARAFYKTSESQKIFRPVGLTETDLGLQYGDSNRISRNFRNEIDRLSSLILQNYQVKAEEANSSVGYNRLGIICSRFAQYKRAQEAFSQALQLDPDNNGARINLGNIHFLQENYSTAVHTYKEVLASLEKVGQGDSKSASTVLLNLARASHMQEQYEDAESYLSRAQKINPQQAAAYAYLGNASAESGRAAESISGYESIIFAE